MKHDTEREEIEKLLTDAGFVKHSGDLHDFGRAMQVVLKGRITGYKEYGRKINIILEFLGC